MLRRRATVRLTFALVAPGVAPIAVTGSGDNSARETCAGASGQTAVRVPGVTNLRKGFNGLYSAIKHGLGRDPLTGGEAFVFCNRRRDTVKIFFVDRDGMWVCAKRLSSGCYRWPGVGEAVVTMSPTELAMLLSGIDLRGAKRQRHWHDRVIKR